MKIINVSRGTVDSNRKRGTRKPPLSCRTGKYGRAVYGQTIIIDGPCRVIYRPDEPLPCGARVWIETDAKVTVKKG